MPSLQDIREFNESLVRLADEPEVVRGWGEEIEDLPEPDEGLDTDLSSLLADTGELVGAPVGLPFEEEDEEEAEEEAEGLAAESPAEAVPEEEFPGYDDIIAEPPPADGIEPSEDVDFSDFEALLSDEPFGDDTPEDEGIGPISVEPEPVPEEDFGETSEQLFEETEPSGEEPSDMEETPGEFELGDAFGAEDLGPVSDEPAPVPEDTFTEDIEPSFEEPEPPGEEPPGIEETAGEFDLGEAFGEDFVEGLPDEFQEMPEPELDTGEFDGFAIDDESFTFEDETAPAAVGVPEEALGEEEPGLEGIDTDLGSFEFSDEDEEIDIPAPSGDFEGFEEPVVPDAESPFETPAVGDEEETGIADVEEIEEIDTTGIDEFSLGDFGAEFGVLQDESVAEEDLNPAVGVPDVTTGVVATGVGAFEISENDFEAFKGTLHALPLNLKLEVEGLITEAKGTTDQVEQLVQKLAARESATDIAALVGRILGKQIRVPRGYEKRSGLEFETERQSFAYQFRENILPILRLVAVIVVVVGILVLAGYHLVFRPLYSRSLYREGLALIGEDQYDLGNRTFVRAREVWVSNRWFYEYAEAFISERQYTLAAEKYEQLLFGMDDGERAFYNRLLEDRQFGSIVLGRDPEKQGVLDYAQFESETLGNYRKADLLLQLVLYDDIADYDGWLAIGDNNMRWAADVPSRYEDARIAYAKLMERYGQTDELLFRMLTYFVRTDKLAEVLRLKDVFQADGRLVVDPVRFSEMAGYLIDRNELDDVEDALFRVMDVNPVLPDVHYQLARYYREIGIPGSEQVALENARRFLEATRPLNGELLGKLVDTHTRIGENRYDAELYLDAQESFSQAIENYEAGLRRRVLEPAPMYGRAYAHLADIFYYVGRQYDDALVYLNRAEENLYDEPNLDYKQGFILYRNGQLNSALAEFREAATDPSASTNALLWSTANTYFRRGNFFAAEAYYRELLSRVELQRDNIRFLLVDEDESHQSAVEYLIRINNNLGVTLKRQYDSTLDSDLFSTALVRLTQSIEYSENYRRDPDTLTRSSAVNLAYLNQRGILYPTPEYSLQIYNELPEDLDDLVF